MPSPAPIRVAQFGLGPIGLACLQRLARKPWVEIVGGVDIRPELAGRPLAALAGIQVPDTVRVHPSFAALQAEAAPQVVLHTAGSKAAAALEQCRPMLSSGLAVVSSCEELLFPWHRAPVEAAAAADLCARSGGRILGTGVNPGFAMDLLPAVLSGVCHEVESIHIIRVLNASHRRRPLQAKIGSGQDPAAFLELYRQGLAGHAGFQESLLLLAHALNWKVGNLRETLEPVVARQTVTTEYFTVLPGQTRGLYQTVSASTPEGKSLHMELTMALDEPDPRDEIRLTGEPSLRSLVPGGIPGDHATVAALVNAIPRLLQAAPGIRLMTDLAPPVCAH